MKAIKVVRSLVLTLGALALLGFSLLVWTHSSEAADGIQSEWMAMTGQQPEQTRREILPADFGNALTRAYGRYERLVTQADFLKDLQTAEIVCVGEAHYDARDVQTAFEITRLLAQRRTVALAVERFAHNLQPRLDNLLELGSADSRAVELKAILQTDDYQKVWGTHPKDRSGFPVNTPSQASFDVMVGWAARARIPLIALDVSLADRAKGLGEDIPYRNELWKGQIENFLERHRPENYLVVVVAGVSHCSRSADSFTSKMKEISKANAAISVGQRDAMYQYQSSAKVEALAQAYGLSDLIVRHPQFAVVSSKGVAEFPDPPDYWIAVHAPDTWN